MSDTTAPENGQNPNFNQASNQPSTNVRKSSGRKPDFYYQAVTREGDTTYWEDIGATWNGKTEGYAKGKLKVDGKEIEIVVQSREARERALSKLRNKKQVAPVELEDNTSPSM
jgi:hypothetical protein